jgi:hypothetical protein
MTTTVMNGSMQFIVTTDATGYVGIGYGSEEMNGADMVVRLVS